MGSIKDYFGLVKFAHTLFAMPFALIAFVYAIAKSGAQFSWLLLAQVVLCMVFARNTAMGFNRWADRHIDKLNPRTVGREMPAGKISPRGALAFVAVNALLFVATASTINSFTAILSPVALAVVMFYSYCKRFTALAHLVLGFSLGIAPAGAYIAASGTLTVAPCILSLLVMTWCGGFDIIYALQDAGFDRANGLHSIPARFSAAASLRISMALHAASIVLLVAFAMYCNRTPVLWTGVVLFCAIIVLEHILVTPSRQKNIGIAFGTLNGVASLALSLFTIADLLLG